MYEAEINTIKNSNHNVLFLRGKVLDHHIKINTFGLFHSIYAIQIPDLAIRINT